MSLKLIANDSATFSLSDKSNTTISGIIIVTKVKMKSSSVGQKNILEGTFVTVSGVTCSGLGAITPDPVPHVASINPTATTCKDSTLKVLRVNDKTDVITAYPLVPGSPPEPKAVTFKVEITDAGQTKVKAV